jgi:hypothetical protein
MRRPGRPEFEFAMLLFLVLSPLAYVTVLRLLGLAG